MISKTIALKITYVLFNCEAAEDSKNVQHFSELYCGIANVNIVNVIILISIFAIRNTRSSINKPTRSISIKIHPGIRRRELSQQKPTSLAACNDPKMRACRTEVYLLFAISQ